MLTNGEKADISRYKHKYRRFMPAPYPLALRTRVMNALPSRARRKSYDEELYKERNLNEPMFNKLKHFRRVATRYDKLDIAYLGFVFIAGIYLWIK